MIKMTHKKFGQTRKRRHLNGLDDLNVGDFVLFRTPVHKKMGKIVLGRYDSRDEHYFSIKPNDNFYLSYSDRALADSKPASKTHYSHLGGLELWYDNSEIIRALASGGFEEHISGVASLFEGYS